MKDSWYLESGAGTFKNKKLICYLGKCSLSELISLLNLCSKTPQFKPAAGTFTYK